MDLLAYAGYGAAREVWGYNRENFKFDQDQQIERETLRLKMQVTRFQLFREDVRDLVKLTVDRMDIYHLVGAMFLQFCVVLFCEGRVQASAPPFLLSLFLLSTASAFVYLLLAVWLSMHASIASHSFGVRLLTRFVRLPIPSIREIAALKYNLKDFEQQGLSTMMRVPVLGGDQQSWQQTNALPPQTAARLPSAGAVRKPTAVGGGEAKPPPPLGQSSAQSRSAAADGASAPQAAVVGKSVLSPGSSGQSRPFPAHWSDKMPAAAASASSQPCSVEDVELLPEEEEEVDVPIGGEDLLQAKRGARPERHIELFRQLQGKWQCYDAYCRVCMSMGVNQMLQGMSYYCICHTLVENHSPTTGYVLIAMFQCTTIALAVLDLAGLNRLEILAVQVVGIMPCLLTCWGVAHRKHKHGNLDPDLDYPMSPFSFLCQVMWLELWFRISSPSDDEAKLPRRFRQTLFLDVFNDAVTWDPNRPDDTDNILNGVFNEDDGGEDDVFIAARQAASQLYLAQCAMRRWRAAPEWGLTKVQKKELGRLMTSLTTWGITIQREVAGKSTLQSFQVESELRPWRVLSPSERAADPFTKCLIGPFEHDGGDRILQYHYDVENERTIFEDDTKAVLGSEDLLVLSLASVATVIAELEQQARWLLEVRIKRDLRMATRQRAKGIGKTSAQQQRMLGDMPLPERCFSARSTSSGPAGGGAFANLVGLFKQPLLRRGGARTLRYARQRDEDEDGEDEAAAAAQVAAAPSPRAELPASSSSSSSSSRRPSATGSQDPTLTAMAGKHAQHFVPERLPWMVVSRMTRVLQFGWFWSGFITLLKELHVYQVDFQQHPAGEDRRLAAADALEFQPLDVEWPHGSLFKAQFLACRGGGGGGRPGEILLGNPFSWYAADVSGSAPSRPKPYARARVPRSAAVLCGLERPRLAPLELPAAAGPPCYVVAPDRGGLRFRELTPEPSARNGTFLPVEGTTWRLVAGAMMPCSSVPSLLQTGIASGTWCVVLAGWDGHTLPLAAVPFLLEDEQAEGQWQDASAPDRALSGLARRLVRPSLDAPLDALDAEAGVAAIALEPTHARLWVLLAGGDVLAWDISEARSLGRWRPRWSLGADAAAFQPLALCEDAALGLLAVGRSDLEGSLLVHAPLPLLPEGPGSEGGAPQPAAESA